MAAWSSASRAGGCSSPTAPPPRPRCHRSGRSRAHGRDTTTMRPRRWQRRQRRRRVGGRARGGGGSGAPPLLGCLPTPSPYCTRIATARDLTLGWPLGPWNIFHLRLLLLLWCCTTVHPGRSGSSGMISTRTDPLAAGWVEARSSDDRSVGAADPRLPPPRPPDPPPPLPPPPDPPPPRAVAAASGRAGADPGGRPRRFAPAALGGSCTWPSVPWRGDMLRVPL